MIVISSTELILDVLNEHVNASKYRSMLETMHLFGKGDMQLVKVAIPERSPVDGKRLAEVDFPHNSVVVAVDRPDSDLEIPDRRHHAARRRLDDRHREERGGRADSRDHRRRTLLGNLDIPLSQRHDGGLRAIGGGKLLENIADVTLHGAEADVQALGDLRVRAAVGDQAAGSRSRAA